MLGFRRSLGHAVAFAALAVFGSSATAQAVEPPVLVAPGNGHVHVVGSPPPVFRIAGTSPNGYGTWVHVSRLPARDAEGVLASDVTIASAQGSSASGWAWTPAAHTYPDYWLMTPGRYWWQAYWIDCTGTSDCLVESDARWLDVVAAGGPPPPPPAAAPTATPAPSSVPDATPPAPDAGITAAPIPRRVASARRPWSYTITLADVPSDVTGARFAAMARTAGRRWGLVPGRVSRTARVVNGDDRTHVGFSWELPEDVLGVQTDAYWVRRHPGRRVCRTKLRAGRRVRSCTRLPGRVTRSLSDRDLAINAEVPWEEGPERPGERTWDLESVLVHELGHMAGNGHRARCVNSPMVAALAAGEWWRSPTDYFFGGCGLTRPSAHASRAAGAPGRLRLVHRVREFDVTEASRAETSAVRSARRRIAVAEAVARRSR